MKRLGCACIIGLLSLSFFGQEQDSRDVGKVEGVVLDENNQPVNNAIVSLQPEDVQVTGKLPKARSNADGKFSIDAVPTGKSFIFASKPSDGYPDAQFAVFSTKDASLSNIIITKGKTTANVTVRLPEKGGLITGRVIDAETGAAVLTARIHLFQANDPERDISTSTNPKGGFEFAVPAIAYKMEVQAPHYKPWKLGQDTDIDKEDSMLIVRGTSKQIVIKLVRIAGS